MLLLGQQNWGVSTPTPTSHQRRAALQGTHFQRFQLMGLAGKVHSAACTQLCNKEMKVPVLRQKAHAMNLNGYGQGHEGACYTELLLLKHCAGPSSGLIKVTLFWIALPPGPLHGCFLFLRVIPTSFSPLLLPYKWRTVSVERKACDALL